MIENVPIEKVARIPIFLGHETSSSKSFGTGNSIMAKSSAMLMPAAENTPALKSMQCPECSLGSHLFQLYETGLQAVMTVMESDTQYAAVNAMNPMHHHRNAFDRTGGNILKIEEYDGHLSCRKDADVENLVDKEVLESVRTYSLYWLIEKSPTRRICEMLAYGTSHMSLPKPMALTNCC